MTDPNIGSLDDLVARIGRVRGEADYPPVEQWQPERTGNSGMRIDRDGTWSFRGSPFKRQAFVRLLASILRRDGDQHWLVTPVEKLRIAVDVAPFLVTDFEVVEQDGQPVLVFATNTGDQVPLDAAHPLAIDTAEDGQPLPLLHVRGGMQGLLSRSAYYRLADLAETNADGDPGVWSSGRFWPLVA